MSLFDAVGTFKIQDVIRDSVINCMWQEIRFVLLEEDRVFMNSNTGRVEYWMMRDQLEIDLQASFV